MYLRILGKLPEKISQRGAGSVSTCKNEIADLILDLIICNSALFQVGSFNQLAEEVSLLGRATVGGDVILVCISSKLYALSVREPIDNVTEHDLIPYTYDWMCGADVLDVWARYYAISWPELATLHLLQK